MIGMIIAYFWHDYGMIFAWFWHNYGVIFIDFNHDAMILACYGMILYDCTAWLWDDLYRSSGGVALARPRARPSKDYGKTTWSEHAGPLAAKGPAT